MAHLNVMKMIGLMVLLAIALTLPQVLPEPASRTGAQTNATVTGQFVRNQVESETLGI